MGNTEQRIVEQSQEGMRLDAYIATEWEYSRAQIQKWIADSLVSVNGQPASKNTRLKFGDRVEVTIPVPVEYAVEPQSIPLSVVYEDDDLLVVNKPKGMVVHPAPGHTDGTLVNALLYHCGDSLSGINGVMRPGIVHRIDKDTSGLLMVAKNDKAHQGLAEQIAVHSFTRIYEAVIVGHLKEQQGIINAPIGRDDRDRKKMAVTTRNAKEAITRYTVLEEMAGYSHLRLQLETGRTHQIRVHMAYLGHPLAGDTVYGNPKPNALEKALQGQCLHAKEVGFVHPVTGENLYFTSDLPEYFTSFLSKIR